MAKLYAEEEEISYEDLQDEEVVESTQEQMVTSETVSPTVHVEVANQNASTETVNEQAVAPSQPVLQQIGVIVNGRTYILKGKPEYVFVDVFDYIDFDLSRPQGNGIVTTLNKQPAQYMETLKHGDVIEIYWKQ